MLDGILKDEETRGNKNMDVQKDAEDTMEQTCKQQWYFGEDANKEETYTYQKAETKHLRKEGLEN